MYARLDDAFYGHEKVLNASFEAIGLYAVALSYCAQQLTDGRLSLGAENLLVRGRRDLVAELVRLRLWDVDAEGNYRIHDYLAVNRSGAQVRLERQATARRVSRHRLGNGVGNGVGNAECTGLEKPARARSRAPRQKPQSPTTLKLSADATSKSNAAFMEGRDFDAWWLRYPRKVGKADAERAWKQTSGARPSVVVLLAGLERQKRSEQWRDSPRFIPHPATWLRRHGWLDETPEQIVAAKRAPLPVTNIPNEKPLRTAGEVASVAQILDVLPWRRK